MSYAIDPAEALIPRARVERREVLGQLKSRSTVSERELERMLDVLEIQITSRRLGTPSVIIHFDVAELGGEPLNTVREAVAHAASREFGHDVPQSGGRAALAADVIPRLGMGELFGRGAVVETGATPRWPRFLQGVALVAAVGLMFAGLYSAMSLGAAFTAAFGALTVFFIGSFAAYELRTPNWLVGPELSGLGAAASFVIAVAAAFAGFAN